MAFSVGDIVISNAASSEGQSAFVGNGVPLIGGVVSDSAGNCVVAWSNGTQTTVTADGANSLTKLKAASAPALALYHQRVTLLPGLGIANPPAAANGLGASDGIVIAVFTASDDTDFVVVEFTGGDVWVIPAAGVVLF